MLAKKIRMFSAFVFFIFVIVLPSSSFAILLKQDGANTEAQYPSFLASIRVATEDDSGIITNTTGAGAFISPNLVVTAAHVVVPHRNTKSSSIVVTGVRRNGTAFAERVKGVRYAQDFPVPYNPGYPVGSDIAVLELHSPISGLDILRLPEDLGIDAGQEESIIGTVYGQMVPNREFIEQAYDRLITPEGHLTEEGRREFWERSDGPERRKWMPSEIAVNAAVRDRHPWYNGAPFVRIQIPRSGDDTFSGETDIAVGLEMGMKREEFINGAYYVTSNLPFHQGDSGAPLVSITEDGQPYLAGVVSDERAYRDTGDYTLFRPRVSVVSTGRVSNIIMRMGPDWAWARAEKEDWDYWANPNGSVAHESNWSEGDGDIKLMDAQERPNEDYLKTCESSGSNFCRYLRSEPTREYRVAPIAIKIDRDTGTAIPTGGVYRINGTLRYFSPQNDTDHATQESRSVFNASGPYGINLPFDKPGRKVIARKVGMPFTDFAPFVPSDGATEATIMANENAPMICLATPSDRYFGNGLYPSWGESFINPQQVQCTVLDEETRGGGDTYLVPIRPEEGSGGATVTIQFRVEPK